MLRKRKMKIIKILIVFYCRIFSMTLHFLRHFSFFWLLHGLIFSSIVLIFIKYNVKLVTEAASCSLHIYRKCLKISGKWLINRKFSCWLSILKNPRRALCGVISGIQRYWYSKYRSSLYNRVLILQV